MGAIPEEARIKSADPQPVKAKAPAGLPRSSARDQNLPRTVTD